MVTLADHAEAWWKESGKEVPPRETAAWREMYESWIDFAFPLPNKRTSTKAERRAS